MNYLRDKVNQKIDLVKTVVNGRDRFSPRVQKIIDKYANEKILGIKIVRTPLSPALTGAFNAVSGGDWNKRMQKTPYDKLYHLWIIIDTDRGRVRFEKNEQINMSERPSVGGKDETMDIHTQGLTVGQLVDNAIRYGGADFYKYSVSNNCQQFILNVLKGSHLSNPNVDTFVKQNTDTLFKKDDGSNDDTLRKVSNTITDLAGRADILLQGGNISTNSMSGFQVSLSKAQLSKLKKGSTFHLSGKQLTEGGEEGTHHRVHCCCDDDLIKGLTKSHKNRRGIRIKGGSIRDWFHKAGEAVNKGIDFVKENAGAAVEGLKKLVPKDAVKSGLTAGATALGTMVGNPELGLLAAPLISKGVDAGYDHDFTQPLTGRRKGSSAPPPEPTATHKPIKVSSGDTGVKIPHNLYNLFMDWYNTEYKKSHPDEKHSTDSGGYSGGAIKMNLAHAGAVANVSKQVRQNALNSGATLGALNPQRGNTPIGGGGLFDSQAFDPANLTKSQWAHIGDMRPICVSVPDKGIAFTGGSLGKRPAKGDKEGWRIYMQNMRSMKKGKMKGGDLADDIDRALNPSRNGVSDAFNNAGNKIKDTAIDIGNKITNKANDAGNAVKSYFDNNGKWIAGNCIDSLPMLTQVLGSMAGEAVGTATGVPLLIPIGATLGSQLGLQAGKYSADQLHKVAGCGLKMKGGRLKKGSPEAKAFMASIRKKKMKGGSFLPLGQ